MDTPPSQPRLFLVGFHRAARLELSDAFCGEGYAVTTHDTPELAEIALGLTCPDAILMRWTDAPPLTSLAFVERHGGLAPTLILTRRHVLIDAVRALRAGAVKEETRQC